MPFLSSTPNPQPIALPAGMRSTRAVQAMLALLPKQPVQGWTEALLESALQTQGVVVNRVTIYRALDRFVQAGLLERRIDEHRLTRYLLPAADSSRPGLAHLECTSCHQSMPLTAESRAVQAAVQALREALMRTEGLQDPRLDIAIQAECPSCSPATP